MELRWRRHGASVSTVIAPSSWPDVDSQPLSLEDPLRLRVASAQVYSAVKSRNMALFERAASFLESAHRLLPGLVPAIKHMKIMFGLRTMVQKEAQALLLLLLCLLLFTVSPCRSSCGCLESAEE